MSETTPSVAPDAADEAAAIDWRSLDVPLRFALGETHVTIGELETVHPGRVFELPDDAQVELSVNGALVARGELVQVGSKLGVRVIEVVKHARHHA